MSDYVNGQVGQTTKWNTTQWSIAIGIAVASYFTAEAAAPIAGELFGESFGFYLSSFAVAAAVTMVTQLGGYLIGRGLRGFDKSNIHKLGWDKEHADEFGAFGVEAASIGTTIYAVKAAFSEFIEKSENYEYEEKRNYFKKCREMKGNYTFYDIERAQRLYVPTFRLGIIIGKINIASKVLLSATYDHAIDMSLDKIKESQHWGEAPERESYLEEQAKEYLLDKFKEANEQR